MEITDKTGENVADIRAAEKAEGVDIYDTVPYDSDDARVSVVVSWEPLLFTYDFGGEWDPETLTYSSIPGWEKRDNIVTVTNRSNCDVEVFIEFVKYDEDDYEEVEMLFNQKSVVLNGATFWTEEEDLATFDFELTASGRPSAYVENGTLGYVLVSIKATDVIEEPTTPPAEEDEENDGEHVCHFVYDQFGRLVCTGCNKVKHTECIDMDEDGICDECGLERDFCPDCHIGGTCRCT